MQKKVLLLIFLDQITKLIFSGRDFFVGPIHLHLVKNFGLAFSLNFGLLINLILITTGLIFFIVYYYRQRHELSQRGNWVFIMIFSGAMSNLIDRLYLGYVRDFLDIGLGFTFNLADAFVLAGLVIILFLQTTKSKNLEDY